MAIPLKVTLHRRNSDLAFDDKTPRCFFQIQHPVIDLDNNYPAE
jgi:hypothetical protein